MGATDAILDGPDYPAPAKLNLFLHVVGRRPDGYHLLQTAFRFVEFGDTLRFRVRNDGAIVRVAGLADVAPEQDLALRAARALQAEARTRLGADIEVVKRLPVGGGLGGGSSDAATTLLVLNRLWKTGLQRPVLMRLGLNLGADVPVFVFGQSAFAEGIGEVLTPIRVAPAHYLVATPPVGVSTTAVFSDAGLTRNTKPIKLAAFYAAGRVDFSACRNDLQPVVVARYPAVAQALEWLGQFGPARMSGSGSSVFLGFESRQAAERVWRKRPPGMQGFVAQGVDDHPLYDQWTRETLGSRQAG